jgi:hypothetical protein
MKTTIIIYAQENEYHTAKSIEELIECVDFADRELICIERADTSDLVRKNLDFAWAIHSNLTMMLYDTGDDHLDRSNALKKAVAQSKGNTLIFLPGTFKIKPGLIEELEAACSEDTIISPTLYDLHIRFWSAKSPSVTGLFLANLDFKLMRSLSNVRKYHTQESEGLTDSIVCTEKVMVIRKSLLESLGGLGDYNTYCFADVCLRNIIRGGKVGFTQSELACLIEDQHDHKEAASIISTYFEKFRKYSSLELPESRQLENTALDKYVPSITSKRGFAADKSIAIVGSGKSKKFVDDYLIKRSDIVIGIDYACLEHRCDYVISKDYSIITDILRSGDIYSLRDFIMPTYISMAYEEDYARSETIFKDKPIYFTTGREKSIALPFGGQSIESLAISVAAYFKPKSITLYGIDTKDIPSMAAVDSYQKKFTKDYYDRLSVDLDYLSSACFEAGISLLRLSNG